MLWTRQFPGMVLYTLVYVKGVDGYEHVSFVISRFSFLFHVSRYLIGKQTTKRTNVQTREELARFYILSLSLFEERGERKGIVLIFLIEIPIVPIPNCLTF